MGLLHVFITLLYSNMLSFIFLPFANSIYFKIQSFGADTKQILYRGSAVPASGAIQLNAVNYPCLVGQAIYAERIQIWDSSSGKTTDFTTHFSFAIDTLNQPNSSYGDGFAFFLAAADFQIPPNSAGSFLGLFNISNYRESSQNQIIVVEFDSFVDEWDPPYQHVGINKNSLTSSNYTAWNAGAHSGDAAEVIISYNATTTMLTVSWTYDHPTSPENSSLSYHVDLKEVLPEWATIGFSSATGRLTEKNILQYWEFDSSLNGKWLSTRRKSRALVYVIPLVVGLVIVIAIVIAAFMIFRRGCKRITWISKETEPEETEPEGVNLMENCYNDDTESEAGLPKRYSLTDLNLATNGFSDANKLGEGGFGGVYKGYLPISVNQEVAIKKISEGSTQGENEYKAEVATISKLKHPNLVELVGWCDETTKFLLVYKIMPNGNLDSYLFGSKDPLDWSIRYKIARGLASALLYLHEQCEPYVIHRDINPRNVLLDSEFNAKLGDFGLARLMDRNGPGSRTTKVAGTLGYLAPEYVSSHKISKALDMYSFGVVALEIGSGRSVEEKYQFGQNSNIGLVEWVWHLYGNKQLHSAVDTRLSDFNEKEYKCLMMVGLSCAHPDPSERSTIKQAIRELEGVILPEVPMNMPVVRYDTPTNVASSSGT